MNQVTCSLCDIKVDEKKWDEHLVSTDHLQLCKEGKGELGTRFFDLIFDTYRKKK